MRRKALSVTASALACGTIVSILCVACFKSDATVALVVGSRISSFDAKDINGSDVLIDFQDDEGRETVLYFFNPRCPRSGQNIANLKELVSQKGRVFRFIGIVSDPQGLNEYITAPAITSL